MSPLKEITTYNRRNKKGVKLLAQILESIPPLDQIYEVTLVDHRGVPYVFRLLKTETEPVDGLEDAYACEDLSVDINHIKEIFTMLTDDQRNIVMHIYYLYKKYKQNHNQNGRGTVTEDPIQNPKIIIQGPAGTGKSTIINLIEKLITWEENKTSENPEKIKVLKCAFTGKAASNIDGVTLNHMFSIPIYRTRSLAKKRLDTKKELLENCIFFICDEISMVGERLMASVNMRLQQIFENDEVYANRFVLLVGDLYQIDPVRQKPVYPKSELWTCCDFYELTKIIRQQDEKFITALNNFRNSQMTEKDIDLLKSREIQSIDEVPNSVIHLFFQNHRVEEYNIYKINQSDGEEEIVNAVDDGEDWLPSNLRVKIGIRYMITHNLNVSDGLANGTTGLARGFDYDENGEVTVIWMEFHTNAIGKKARSDYFKDKPDRPGFEKYVPICQSHILLKLKSDPKFNRKVGNMFPLKAAEAMTVHKSQGQTYHDGVCIHFTTDSYDKLRTDKSLQYVALTRVKRIEDLYIVGSLNISVKHSDKFIRTENELNRLRAEKNLKLAYETFKQKSGDVLIFLNSGLTFNEHSGFISSDKWYNNGSLLIFAETNTIGSEDIVIPNFEIAYRSDGDTALRSGGGIICYKEKSTSVKFVSSLADDENNIYLSLLLYEDYLYIITAIKGDLKDDDFLNAIDKFILQYVREGKCICFVGNFDPKTTPSLTDDRNFRQKLSSNIDAKDGNQCDVVLTRNFDIHQDLFGFYEYIPSSNRPMYVKLPPKSKCLENDAEEKMEVE